MKKLLFLAFLFFGIIGNVEAVSLNTNISERLNKGNTIQIYKNVTLPNYTSNICRKIENSSGVDDVFIPLNTETEFQAFLNNSPAYLIKNVCHVTSTCTPNPSNSTVYTATNISQFSSDGVNWSPSNVSYHSNTSTTTTCAYRCNPGYFYNGSSCPAATPGYYTSGYGNTSQTACTPGNYQPSSAQTSCMSATPGYYVPGGAATSQTPASPGYYVSGTSQTSQTACTPGNYQPSSGQTNCINSTPGYYVSGGAATNQIACSAGSYQPSSGQSSCISAGTGQYQDLSGQTTVKSCSNKPANSSYSTSSGLTSNSCPWTCNPNYHLEGGICVFDFESQVASCSSKPANSYWNTVSSITQSRNWTGSAWSAWSPTTSTSYSASSSTSTCQYDCDNGYQNSGASCIPKNCSGVTNFSGLGYDVGGMLHGGTTISGKSYAISNGTMSCTQGFSCSFGNTSINGGESCSITCNSGHVLNGSVCEPVPVCTCPSGYSLISGSCTRTTSPILTPDIYEWYYHSVGGICLAPITVDEIGFNGTSCSHPGDYVDIPRDSNVCGFDIGWLRYRCDQVSIGGVSCPSGYVLSSGICIDTIPADCSGGPVPTYTYSWSTSGWGSCSANPTWSSWSACSGGTQSRTCSGTSGSQLRTVQCLRSDGAVVADSNCSGGKPSTFQSCTSSCSGVSSQSCTVAVNGTCGTSHAGTFSSAPSTGLCSSGSPTAISGSGPWSWTCLGSGGGTNMGCSASYNPSYTYSWSTGGWSTCSATPTWSSWSACSGGTQSRTCSGTSGSQSRTVQCLRSDGTVVADTNCTGIKPFTSVTCSTSCTGSSTQACSSFDGNSVLAGCYVDTINFDLFEENSCYSNGVRPDGQNATLYFSVGDIDLGDSRGLSVPATVTWGPGCTPNGISSCIITQPCAGGICPALGTRTVTVNVTYGAFSKTYSITGNDDTYELSSGYVP